MLPVSFRSLNPAKSRLFLLDEASSSSSNSSSSCSRKMLCDLMHRPGIAIFALVFMSLFEVRPSMYTQEQEKWQGQGQNRRDSGRGSMYMREQERWHGQG